MVRTNEENLERVQQGDILSDVEYIESVTEQNGIITVSKIIFPLVIVLTQDCDLTWDFKLRRTNEEARQRKERGEREVKESNQDKYLFSAIVAPLYNYEHFVDGEHLLELGQKMGTFSRKLTKTDNKNLRQNNTPRYHYLQFDESVPIVNSVIDFKHYFTVNIEQLREHKRAHYVCSVSELFRERISQRFANYLSRIGLPDATGES